MVGHRTVNAAVAGSSPAIRAISLSLRLNVHVFAPRLAVIITPLMCEAVAKLGRGGVSSPSAVCAGTPVQNVGVLQLPRVYIWSACHVHVCALEVL